MAKKSKKSKKLNRSQPNLQSIEHPIAHPLVVEAVRVLKSRGQTVCFAESCTGGLLSAVFTRMPGVSDVFLGSVIAYSNGVKENLLAVPASMLQVLGAVSIPVSRKMASGARQLINSSWAISITGVAGPTGGSFDKPVGKVCFAIVGPGVDKAFTRFFNGTRREIQSASARFALKILIRELDSDFFISHRSRKSIEKKSGKKRS